MSLDSSLQEISKKLQKQHSWLNAFAEEFWPERAFNLAWFYIRKNVGLKTVDLIRLESAISDGAAYADIDEKIVAKHKKLEA